MGQRDKLDGFADGVINSYIACRALFEGKQCHAGRGRWASKHCPERMLGLPIRRDGDAFERGPLGAAFADAAGPPGASRSARRDSTPAYLLAFVLRTTLASV